MKKEDSIQTFCIFALYFSRICYLRLSIYFMRSLKRLPS